MVIIHTKDAILHPNKSKKYMNGHKVDYYLLSTTETFQKLQTTPQGLTSSEVLRRTSIYGNNRLKTIKGRHPLITFFNQFRDLMVILLIISGMISLYLGEYRDVTILFSIVIINALIGFFQEYKAEKIMNALKVMIKSNARVIRNGKEIEVKSEELVPGDIIKMNEGDAVPADTRIFEENNLSSNDFALTGESNPKRKFHHTISAEVALGDRNNIVFMGTTIATGNALGVVIATGMQTEVGRIANLSQDTSADPSPLQKELEHLAKKITLVAITIAAVLFLFTLGLHFTLREAMLFALGVAASCVPQGLPAQISVALSLAAGRLSKKNAIIKKLSAVETLGSTHIICTDKTGTLTKNEMTVQKIFIGGRELTVSGLGYEPVGEISEKNRPLKAEQIKQIQLFFETGFFATNARVNPPDNEHASWYCVGDPTEAALITLGSKTGLNPDELDKKYPELLEFPFDSVRKRMTSIRKRNGKYFAYVKGSPQGILEKCTHIWDGKKIRKITTKDRKSIQKKDDSYALNALRNLAFAYRELPSFSKKLKMEAVEEKLVYLGLAAMIDPPRAEVKNAMEVAAKAKIRVIIITGDYALTAEAIARMVNLSPNQKNPLEVVNGNEIEKLSDHEIVEKIQKNNLIFARTSPEDKLRIVGLLKKAGEIVAVTGDGVNDAPALKKADIGVAMGKTGTEVAKDASEIVLLDDSFSTLVSAIKEGRVIFQNLKKTIISCLTSNSGELFAVLLSLLGSTFFNFPIAILAVQILAIDLIGEMLPLTFLTWDPAQPHIMETKPRNPNEHVMNKHSIWDLAWTGFIMGGIGYINFLLVFAREGISPANIGSDNPLYMRATTLTYLSIVVVQWMNILSRRTEDHESVFSSYLWSNKRLLAGFSISLFFIFNIIYNPFISELIRTAPLTIIDWIFALIGGFIYLAIHEFSKYQQKSALQLIQ